MQQQSVYQDLEVMEFEGAEWVRKRDYDALQKAHIDLQRATKARFTECWQEVFPGQDIGSEEDEHLQECIPQQQQLQHPAAGQFGGPVGPYQGQGGWQGQQQLMAAAGGMQEGGGQGAGQYVFGGGGAGPLAAGTGSTDYGGSAPRSRPTRYQLKNAKMARARKKKGAEKKKQRELEAEAAKQRQQQQEEEEEAAQIFATLNEDE